MFWAKVWVKHLSSLALCGLAALALTALAYRLLRVLGPQEREFLRRSHVPGRNLFLRIL